MVNEFDKNSQSVQWLLNEILNIQGSKVLRNDTLNTLIGEPVDLGSDVLLMSVSNITNLDILNNAWTPINTVLSDLYPNSYFNGFIALQIVFPDNFINTDFSFESGVLMGIKPEKNTIINCKYSIGNDPIVINPSLQVFNVEAKLNRILTKFDY